MNFSRPAKVSQHHFDVFRGQRGMRLVKVHLWPVCLEPFPVSFVLCRSTKVDWDANFACLKLLHHTTFHRD